LRVRVELCDCEKDTVSEQDVDIPRHDKQTETDVQMEGDDNKTKTKKTNGVDLEADRPNTYARLGLAAICAAVYFVAVVMILKYHCCIDERLRLFSSGSSSASASNHSLLRFFFLSREPPLEPLPEPLPDSLLELLLELERAPPPELFGAGGGDLNASSMSTVFCCTEAIFSSVLAWRSFICMAWGCFK